MSPAGEPRRAGAQHGEGDGGEHGEDRTVDQHLHLHRAALDGDELRHEGDHEQPRLGVEHVGEQARGEDAPQRLALRRREADEIVRADGAPAQPQQVGRADQLDHPEGERIGLQHQRQAQRTGTGDQAGQQPDGEELRQLEHRMLLLHPLLHHPIRNLFFLYRFENI